MLEPAVVPKLRGWAKERVQRRFHWFEPSARPRLHRTYITACGSVVYTPDQWALPELPDSEKCRRCSTQISEMSLEANDARN